MIVKVRDEGLSSEGMGEIPKREKPRVCGVG